MRFVGSLSLRGSAPAIRAQMSLNQCAMTAQPYIAQWINYHPKWMAVRWHCEYAGGKEKI
jgi:hypothetical protein